MAEEIPPEVKAFAALLHLDVVDTPIKVQPPGFMRPVWLIPVRDEATGETVGILNAYPPKEVERYRVITIVNKLGNPVNVIVFKEEAERLKTPEPEPEEVKRAVEEAEERVPEKVVSAPVDWRRLKELAERVQTWLSQMRRQAEARNAVACHTYLKSICEWMDDARKELLEKTSLLSSHEARKAYPKVLKDEEYRKLWEKFSGALKEAGVNPEEWRRRFDELIAWDMPYEDNEIILMDEARKIIFQKRLERYLRRLPEKAVKFNWKYIEWGIGALNVSTGLLKDAVEEENAVQAYSAIKDMISTAEKMKDLLETLPEVKAFLGLKP